MVRFILIYLKLYLFKALFIQSFILYPLNSNRSPIISNNAYPFLSNSKISFKS